MSNKLGINSSEDMLSGGIGEPAFLPHATVAIMGLGLIGGSMAMVLKGHCARLLGIDQDPEVVNQVLACQIVDEAHTEPAALLPQADLVILAVPVVACIRLISQLPQYHSGQCILIDVGSTKREIVQAMAGLPKRFDPIGGHPMCGKEMGTLANAEADLFQESAFALVPLHRTTPHARAVAAELVAFLGAHALWLDADRHDLWVASTSHLPHLVATALALSTPVEYAHLAGPGFRSTSRLAAGSAEMKVDFLLANRRNVLEALDIFRNQLGELADMLEMNDSEALKHVLAEAAEHRQEILEGANAF